MNFENFSQCSLEQKAEWDSFDFYSKFVYEDQLKLLDLNSFYLQELERFQLFFITDNNIPFDDLSTELKLLLLANRASEECDARLFLELYDRCCSLEDIKYNWTIRRRLIELSLIDSSESFKDIIRQEFLYLSNAYDSNNLSEMYKFSMQIANADFINFNESEKEIVLKILQVDSEPVALAIAFSLDEDKIGYGTWKEFWHTVSNYEPGDDLENNLFLGHKAMCIESDFSDERLNMSIFPHLPDIYDEDNSYLYGFAHPIDWNKKLELYEIDFVLAIAMTMSGASRSSLVEQVIEYFQVNNTPKQLE